VLQNGSAMPMALVMLACAAAGLLAYVLQSER